MFPCFEGACVNCRNPPPRRGKPRVGSAPHVALPADRSRSGRSGPEFREAHFDFETNDFGTFCGKMTTFLGVWPLDRPLGAKIALKKSKNVKKVKKVHNFKKVIFLEMSLILFEGHSNFVFFILFEGHSNFFQDLDLRIEISGLDFEESY